MSIKIGITAGDLAGVSGTIVLKALNNPEISKMDINLYGDDHFFNKLSEKMGIDIPKNVKIIDPLKANFNLDILGKPSSETGKGSGFYFQKGVEDALNRDIDAIVTAPLNKDILQEGGFPYTGHTTMLKSLTKTDDVVMMLYGEKLKVALLTIHTPISKVSDEITEGKICKVVKIVNREMWDKFSIKDPKIAILGVNPHAGENGKLGKEERDIVEPTLKKLRKEGIKIDGPFPADTYFAKHYKDYDVTIAAYHDQGLTPLKMLHFDDGVNITLGVPVVRTSVDHGTAYDIAAKFTASEKSLITAIKEGYRIAELRSKR